MKKFLFTGFINLLFVLPAFTQQSINAEQRIRDFHAAIVLNKKGLSGFLHDSLSYGHSNGWVQDKIEFLEDMNGKILYHSFSTDSLQTVQSKKILYARFQARVDATLKGSRATFNLHVLEVWVKRGGNWLLLVRQAIKI